MNGPPSAEWDWLADAARQVDEATRDPARSWVPPNLAILVAAVRATTLVRLYPFASLHRFCLSDGPRFWAGEGQVAPAFVSRDRDSGYTVWRGGPYDENDWSVTVTLCTEDPKAAAAELERLLGRWPAFVPSV